jgi:hypothetical protein
MNILSKFKTVLILVVFVVIVGSGLAYGRQKAFAEWGIPYGGFIITPFWCPCSGDVVLLTLSPGFFGPEPAAFQASYVMGSEIFAYWNLGEPGIWAIGFGSPPIPCLVFAPHSGCFPVGEPIINLEPFSGSSLTI